MRSYENIFTPSQRPIRAKIEALKQTNPQVG